MLLVANLEIIVNVLYQTQGLGYPLYAKDGRLLPNQTEGRFALMDTNGDGKLDNKDDPYAPYWPGDEYVDWVGLSGSYRGRVGPNDQRLAPPSGSFASLNSARTATASIVTQTIPTVAATASLTARPSPTVALNFLPPTEPQRNSEDNSPFSISFEEQLTGGPVDLYKEYAEARQKPVFLWNVGAAFYVDGTGADESSLKLAWLSQILNTKKVHIMLLTF